MNEKEMGSRWVEREIPKGTEKRLRGRITGREKKVLKKTCTDVDEAVTRGTESQKAVRTDVTFGGGCSFQKVAWRGEGGLVG